ncbi:MAG: iron ABC transporter permease [Clostridia bacterium]
MKIKEKVWSKTLSFIILSLMLVALFVVSINLGSIKVGALELFKGLFLEYNKDVATIFDLRFPRVIISMLAGAALAVSGALLQAVLKNPLADPGIIGVSSGASFMSVIVIGLFPSLYFYSPLFGFIGGVLAFVLVYSLSYKQGLSPMRILLVGIAIQALFEGLSSAVNSATGGDMSGVADIVNGNITMKTWNDVTMLFWYAVPALIIAMFCAKKCDLIALEDRTVKSLGINVNFLRFFISLVAVLLASSATSVVGIVGFLGLLVPHIARLIVGSGNKVLLPFSAVLGAFVFLLADTIGRTIVSPFEINPSVIMAVIGGPVFIILLKRSTTIHGK